MSTQLDSSYLDGFLFGGWQIDPRSGEVTRPGHHLRLEPKPMAVLVELARANGNLVSKDELMAEVWADTCVGEDSLWRSIHTLRKTLEQGDPAPTLIETVPRRGYRLTAPVEPLARAEDAEGPGVVPVAAISSGSESTNRSKLAFRYRNRFWRWGATAALAAVALLLGAREITQEITAESTADRSVAPSLQPVTSGSTVEGDKGVELQDGAAVGELTAEDYFERGRRYYGGLISTTVYSDLDLDRAIALFERAAALDPRMAIAHAELASARLLRERLAGKDPRTSEALCQAELARDLDPDLPEAHKALALIYQKQGRLEEAERELELALTLRGDYTAALDALASLRMGRGRLREALELRRRLVGSELPQAKVLSFLGHTLLQLGDNDEAREQFLAALDHEPYHVVAVSGLAMLDMKAGDSKAALRRLEEAAAVHRESVVLREHLAQIHLLVGDLGNARRWLEEASALPAGNEVRIRLRLAWVEQRLGKGTGLEARLHDYAEKCLAAMDFGDDSPQPRLFLAAIEGLLGRTDLGLAWLEDAIDRGYTQVETLQTDPLFDTFWDQPGFNELMARSLAERGSVARG